MATATATQSLVRIEDRYPVLAGDPKRLMTVIRENLGDLEISPFDFSTVKIPGGGGMSFQVFDGGNVEEVKEVSGIIVHASPRRGYWRASIDDTGGGAPPDCSSNDGVTGRGTRWDGDQDGTHGCATCALAKFGSATKGGGQACKMNWAVFLLWEGEMLPRLLKIPPSSLKVFRALLISLTTKEIPKHSVLVKFGLERAKGNGTPDYARLKITGWERLAPETAARVAAYAEAIKPQLETIAVAPDDDASGGVDLT